MHWLLSLFSGLLTAVVTCIGAGFVAALCVRWYRMSSFEGASGYFVVFMGLLGGIVGMITGIVCSRVVSSWPEPSFMKGLGLALGSLAALLLVLGVIARLAADIPPTMEGRFIELLIEVRGPENFKPPVPEGKYGAFACVFIPGRKSMRSGELRIADARQEDGRWIVTATVPLETSARRKYLRVYFNKEHDVIFPLHLRAHPDKRDLEWSKWVDSAWDASKPEPPPAQKFGLRYRVQVIVPPPPPPDPEQVIAKKFAALKPDSPLEEWLAYLAPANHYPRMTATMEVLSKRQPELAAAIGSANSAMREPALTAVTMLTEISPEIAAAVVAEGRLVADGVRAFNNTVKEDDPRFYDVQIELRTRFSYWHRAWWAVHQRTGADGRPPVQEILDLAQQRSQGTTMGEIVANARAHLDGIKPREEKTP